MKAISEAEESAGNKFLYNDKFSALTLPENLYEEYLKGTDIPVSEFNTAVECQKRLLKAFIHNLGYHECKDIYTRESIEKYIKNRQYPIYDFQRSGNPITNPAGIAKHLENIINLLEKFDKYEMAIVSENKIADYKHIYMMIKERHSAKIRMIKDNADGTEADLSIEEPTVVNALKIGFLKAWDRISPVDKDKRDVIAWLKSQINLLSGSL